ncbi:Anaerobic glycerol-3-phosphate dehydrogenase subunit C [Polystyrenella longa]|uniref:Anaerobic glycerol-3-phosphate dehydrogenase subunit C n=1 Tax=Polystyrenella longa TaxID=2528007 RepID=A0A518CR79_9PLAN|nr:anaerobic glycerol-3-phosphate dehydrogenase subunit C [Polystyrenella longa]QDU81720.1 Anaerobic glycerol-3-phosphate dehydrogenase subunit C [Polystyrenella longa]
MDEERRGIYEDLSSLIEGDIRCDASSRAIYSADASLYAIDPLAIVAPKHSDDVVALARYAHSKNYSLTPRGAGTGTTGSCLGSGIIVDFSRYMNQIEWIDEETVRVQPGITRARLNQELAKSGRYFAPDPANADVTTIGGMLGVNSAGSRSVHIGTTRDHVHSIELVTSTGHRFEAGLESLRILTSLPPQTSHVPLVNGITSTEDPVLEQNYKRTLVSKLAKLLEDNEELIYAKQPSMLRNTCGYIVRKVLLEGRVNLPRLLVGSEGTLGMFTAATLHTTPLPEFRGIALILFGQTQAAIQAMQAITPLRPSACDLLDRRLISLAREADDKFAQLITPAAEAAMLVEVTGLNEADVKRRLQSMLQKVRSLQIKAVFASESYDREDVEFLWSLPRRVVPHLSRLGGVERPVPFVEDVAVSPDRLGDFLSDAQKVFQKHQVTASLYTHAASGQVHFRPFLPTPTQQTGHKLEAIARDLYQIVFRYEGTISGEHGDGLSRTAFIRSQYGDLYRVFQQVKDLFDPHNLMNPGKIISDDPHLTTRYLRPSLPPEPQYVKLQVEWTPQELFNETSACNGCGSCKSTAVDLRMCPFNKRENTEENSPRAKANLLRTFLTRRELAHRWSEEEIREVTDSCFNCKQCQLECPSNVDIPYMVLELKANYVATHGLKQPDWVLSRAHSFGSLGCSTFFLANRLIGNRLSRWFIEKIVGISRYRKLPYFARRTFVKGPGRAYRKLPPRSGNNVPVVYFMGDYANHHDHQLARAFIAILEHHDIQIHIPPHQASSGMAMISAGDFVAARDVATTNIRELVELAREDYRIVCTEPASAIALKQEYPRLVDHPDVQIVADQVIEAGAFLEELHLQGKLKTDFKPLPHRLGYHTPCHLKALGKGTPLMRLLELIPELEMIPIEEGCSGMAGTFGMARDTFDQSLEIGHRLIERMQNPDFDFGTTECASCKMQMEQGTTMPTLHPLKILALAYGLLPEVEAKLRPNNQRLIVS